MEVPTTAYKDQKPGTSGLRKKVTVFQQPNYTANFVQSTFNALHHQGAVPDVLVVGGDGRYYTSEAVQVILKVSAANGVRRVWVGQHGLLSTPAVSTMVRRRRDADGRKATGAFILTASHNPGGPDADFGIKYNSENGGPAAEKLTSQIYEETVKITHIKMAATLPEVDIHTLGTYTFDDYNFQVEVVDSLADYAAYMQEVFDFEAIKALVQRLDFKVHVDSLHGVSGPYVDRIFHECLGVPKASLFRTNVLPDFGGCHPDPNLTYAADLVHVMGLLPDGNANPAMKHISTVPSFGVAFDGDADRNMILGCRFFVNPSDSLAVLAANADCVPFFTQSGNSGLKAVARSMPTSGAVDRVAAAQGFTLFEVPTGWKFFGNLMDSKDVYGGKDLNPLLCGEESFGTGSNHIREKDGIWASLFWLSVIAKRNVPGTPLVGVQKIVEEHWATYGRNYYSRYDYEDVSAEAAKAVMETVENTVVEDVPHLNGVACKMIDNFSYTDPIDGSVSTKQGVRVLFEDGSRFVLRLSGTGSSGATIRLYLEQYMDSATVKSHLAEKTLPSASTALKALIGVALQVSKMESLTGRKTPTVIT
ncbi:phosphoglucomutase [Leishmania donovani]|uniref:phosphoglucomutase (alpha-D-glucose-1,6-bisphosphate-dependent) n=9 Tax=Leishmania donovani species complex TaxID=38574 RepID=A0A3Q8IBZ3_LEIDO|nr:phosphoglucomutase, putative [Leishmania donovani]AYU78530.1 phosphoglucomutase, putative [Leishmania donovani]TPP49298.1 Phosphoglucomutase/phosphomannomutase, alpha/beta/alpha domain I family protein [Leishmania donovani]CAJ1988538.1 phosphoglucomutase [Leishmania donovani]CBZ33881.1 phosphoglucomutase, putative [Leishmania donovani]VDZ44419.1 phosphoglucomutase_putative/GeneDB:LmjF.21.0640 [Leishmania donovani]